MKVKVVKHTWNCSMWNVLVSVLVLAKVVKSSWCIGIREEDPVRMYQWIFFERKGSFIHNIKDNGNIRGINTSDVDNDCAQNDLWCSRGIGSQTWSMILNFSIENDSDKYQKSNVKRCFGNRNYRTRIKS